MSCEIIELDPEPAATATAAEGQTGGLDSTEFVTSTSSGSQQSLPDTQPAFGGLAAGAKAKPNPWAILITRGDYYRTVTIEKSVFSCGRENCDYVLTHPGAEQPMPDDCVQQFSRKHFVLEKVDVLDNSNDSSPAKAPAAEVSTACTESGQYGFDVYIADHSSNGTFVNGELVGKGNKRAIVDGDTIAMTNASREAFRFILMESHKNAASDVASPKTGATATAVTAAAAGTAAAGTGTTFNNSNSTLGGSNAWLPSYPPGLLDKYVVGRKIGTGACGTVHVGYSKVRRDEKGYPFKVAIKVISRRGLVAAYNSSCNSSSHLSGADTTGSSFQGRGSTVQNAGCSEDSDNFWQEVEILRKLDSHPCVISFHDVFDSPSMFVIVLELAKGGELFDYVLEDYKAKTFDEKATKIQFYQILSAVEYLHEMNVCHRDIKLENILLAEKNKVGLIKITDFGLSKLLDEQTVMNTYVGTPTYIAPEVLKNSEETGLHNRQAAYTVKADMWSLGCILYSLFCGSPAFYGNSDQELGAKILRGEFKMDGETNPVWSKVSPEGKELISRLLVVNPRNRISARDALRKSDWFIGDPETVAKAQAIINKGRKAKAKQQKLLAAAGVEQLHHGHRLGGSGVKAIEQEVLNLELECKAKAATAVKDDDAATATDGTAAVTSAVTAAVEAVGGGGAAAAAATTRRNKRPRPKGSTERSRKRINTESN